MKTSLRQKIKRIFFKKKMQPRLAALEKEISEHLGATALSLSLDPREPYSPRALCFIVSIHGEPRYFGKQIETKSVPDHYDYAGVYIFNGQDYIDKSMDVACQLSAERLSPEITLAGNDIMLIDYLKHPTFIALGAYTVNLSPLLGMAIRGLRALHDRGLVHLDPNWGNFFMVDPEGLPVIIDFDRKLSDDLAGIPAESIDFLSSYGGLFLTRQLQQQCTDNACLLAETFWRSLQQSEQDALALITPQHVRTLYPKLARKPNLRTGLASLEAVSGLTLLDD